MGNPKTATTSGNSTSSGSSTTTLSPEVQAAYNSLLNQISGLSSGTNTSTGTAASGLANLSATPNANYGTAANTLGSASTPAYQSISDYLSPYLTSGLSALQASQQNQNAQQQQQLVGNAISQGALGGNRVAVAQSNLAGQQALANNATNAAFVNNAYQQAENAALTGQSNETAAGSAQTNLGSSENASSLANLLGLLSAGNSQYSNLGTLGSLASNLSNSGATVSTNSQSSGTSTVPVGNTFSSLLGGLTSIAGLFKDGGVVPRRYDVGGSISELAQSANSGMDQSQQLMQSLMQAGQNAAQQQNQQPQYTDEQKKGAANIGNWAKGLFPGNDNATAAMASGGVIPFRRRDYDDGGYVDFPYADFSDINGTVPNAPAGVLPALVGNSDVTVPSNYIVAPSMQGMINQVTPQPGILANPSLLRATPTDNPATRRATRDQAMADQGFPAQSSGVIPPRNTPLTVATNNPGAITNGPWAASQPGYVGAHGDFAVFDSPEAGRNAQVGLLSNYADKGYNTIASVINRWSPQSANAPGSTANYIDYVSQRTGLAPNQPIPPGRLGDVAQAQSEWESGLKPGGFVPPAPGGVVPSAQGTQGAGTPAIQSPAVSGVIPAQYGIQDSNAGYATNLGDVFKSLQEGKGLNLSPDARMALISAGAGMMAGTSPNAFANIGSGIQQGLDTWQKKQELNRENALAQSGIGAQQGELGLEGQKVQQAGQQLYLNAQQTAAQIAKETAAAAHTNVEAAKARFVPTPIGMMQYDPENPNTAPKVIPWNQLQGAAGVPGSAGQTGNGEQPKPDADGFVTTAPPATTINPMLMSQSSAPIVYEQTKTALGGAQGDAINAQALNAQLGELANLARNMPDTGPLASGAAFDQRLSAVKGINGFLQTIGAPQIDPKDVATAEGMKKLATQLQFAVADAVKTDPAAATIAQAASASPSGENTKQGFAQIVGNIEALNKRSIDRFNFLQSWANQHYGDTTGADATFNQLNPPEKYIAYGDKLAESLGATPASQSIPTVTTQKAYDALPSGSVYIAPDGKQHRKQ